MEKIRPHHVYFALSGASIGLSVVMYFALKSQLGKSNWDCWASNTSRQPMAVGGLKDYECVTDLFYDTVS